MRNQIMINKFEAKIIIQKLQVIRSNTNSQNSKRPNLDQNKYGNHQSVGNHWNVL